MVSIKGLDKAKVLQALHQGSRAQGMSLMHERPVSLGECQEALQGDYHYFDYFVGRVIKVDLSGDEFEPWGYDRDNGEGAAQAVIDKLRAS